jgi:hypothetical protein
MNIRVKVGDKIQMTAEKQRYTVQGVRGHFIIATKSFNAKRTYLYTLIDTKEKIRGPLNSIFGLPCHVNSPEGASELFDWIESDDGWETWHVSHRNRVDLTASEIDQIMGPAT